MKKLQYKEIKQTFIDFLKAHDAFTKFVVYLCHPKNKDWYIEFNGPINRTFSTYVAAVWSGTFIHSVYGMQKPHHRLIGLMYYAFLWKGTPEGDAYWLHLADEWRKVVYDKYKVSGLLIV